MQVTISIYCFYALQCLILSSEVYGFLTKKVGVANQRMFVFSLLHVVSNAIWIFVISGSTQGLIAEILFIITSLGTLAYTYHIWCIQINIKNTKHSVHWLIFHSLAIIFLFSRINWAGGIVKHEWAFILTFVYAQGVALFFGGRIFLKIIRMKVIDPLHQIAIIVSSVVFCFLPFIVFFIQDFSNQYILLNASFFFMVYAYLKKKYLRGKIIPLQGGEQQRTLDNYTEESKSVFIRIGKKSKEIKAYKQQLIKLDAAYKQQSKNLSECLENNFRLMQESAEKSALIEQYKNQNEATIESVLHKYDLTESQLEVVKMMVEGKTNVEIADKLFIKEGVVRTHLSAAYKKVGIRGVTKLRFFILKQINSK